MRFRFIDAERASYPLTVLCRVLCVSRAGYYAWQAKELSAHDQRDAALTEKIERYHAASHGRYGSPRIFDD